MELLATVDWLVDQEGCVPTLAGIREGLAKWPAGASAAERKVRLFNERSVWLALERLTEWERIAACAERAGVDETAGSPLEWDPIGHVCPPRSCSESPSSGVPRITVELILEK